MASNIVTTIKKKDGEYCVRLHINGVWQKDANYYTDDKDDAYATSKHMLDAAIKLDKEKA